jgi:hypothetical protein
MPEVRVFNSQNMNAQDKTTEKPILVNLSERLMEAQRELDELTLQLALGKAEAKEKFEEIKKQFNTRLSHLRKTLTTQKTGDLTKEITTRLDELEKVLNAGKVEDKEMFVAQKKLILKSLYAFENEVKKRLPENLDTQHFAHEIENFKLKLEILRLKFALKRFAIQDDVKTNMDEARRKVSGWIDKAREKVIAGEKKIIEIQKGVKKTYSKAEKSFS